MEIAHTMMRIPDLIQLCRDLIQTPSVNGLHPERAVAERVLAFARHHGLAAETVAREADRPVVLVRSGPPTTPALIFVAHLDTVAAGDPAAWRYPPFAGEIVGERIYGRGTIDNKGGLVAALAALLLLAQEPDCLALLIGVPDEESGATGELGIRFLQQQGLLSGSAAIYTYPGSDKIILGHRGVLRLRLEARGTAMHTGSRSWQNAAAGANAITALADLLLTLDALPLARRHGSGLFAPYSVQPMLFPRIVPLHRVKLESPFLLVVPEDLHYLNTPYCSSQSPVSLTSPSGVS
jgi:acetylornithine deacetylase/succinyl-diaminopimelate desuccinylase-like protein